MPGGGLLLSASDAVFRDMQITVQYVGDMLCEACSRHSGDTTRFVRKDLSFWYGTQGHCFRAYKENIRAGRAAEKNVRTG